VLVLVIASILEVFLTQADADEFELNRAIIRGAYLIVIGGMLAYVSAFRERRRERLARLADWPAYESPAKGSPAIAKTLAHSADVFEAPRVLIVWEEVEEPFVNIAIWEGGNCVQMREFAGTFSDLVHRELVDSTFASTTVAQGNLTIRQGLTRVASAVLDADLTGRFGIVSVATAPFVGTICRGRVFILDRDSWSEDDLPLTEIVASRIGMELDRQALQLEAEESAAAREGIRVTRDLRADSCNTGPSRRRITNPDSREPAAEAGWD